MQSCWFKTDSNEKTGPTGGINTWAQDLVPPQEMMMFVFDCQPGGHCKTLILLYPNQQDQVGLI